LTCEKGKSIEREGRLRRKEKRSLVPVQRSQKSGDTPSKSGKPKLSLAKRAARKKRPVMRT